MQKIIFLTGATDGIGLETAKTLAGLGSHLLLHGRNANKLANVKQDLLAQYPQAQIDTFIADLSSLNEAQQLAHTIKQQYKHLDVIINNAGVFKTNTPITHDGLDVRFVVNTLAPYLLTQTLLPLLTQSGRVVNLSSAAQAPVNLDALRGDKQLANDFMAYAQSKLALTMWSQQMGKALHNQQVIVAVNPGSLLASKMVKEGFGVAGNDLSIGADILVRAALSDEFSKASGLYFDNDTQQFAKPHADALDEQKCAEVVMQIEQLIKKLS